MAKNAGLRRQAKQIAAAGLPSAHSIRHQYARQEGDVANFSSALVSLLKGQQGVAGQAYGQAIQQQQGIDAAARQQLGNLGEQYAGAGVKVGATGDSAVSSLLGGQAAAQDYASRQPGIAAGRGALGQTALQNALSDALSQRADQIHQGFLPAYTQLKQNAFSQKMALSQLGLSKRSLADQEAATAFSQSEQVRSDNASIASARQAESHWRLDFIGRYGFDPYTGKTVKTPGSSGSSAPSGFTPNEWRSTLKSAAQTLAPPADRVLDPSTHTYVTQRRKDFVQQGILFGDAVKQLVSQAGFDKRAALVAAVRLYRTYGGAPRNSPAYKAWASYFNYIKQPRTAISAAEARNQGLTGPH